MTEIVIRNGVQRSLSNEFVITAWDATVNNDNIFRLTAGTPAASYSTWNEYDMSATKNMVSVYDTITGTATQSREFLPNFYQLNDNWNGVLLPYPIMDFNQEAAIRYAGTTDIFNDVSYNARVYMAVVRFSNFTNDKKAFVLSIGATNGIGNTPLWTYADLHVYRNSSTNHDHLISRVGASYISTRITGWNPLDVNVFTLVFDGSMYCVYLNNHFMIKHNAIVAGGLWTASGGNWTSVNTMWIAGKYGYLHLADTFTYYTDNIGIHAITHVKYNDFVSVNGEKWPDAVDELCHYRYAVPSPPTTSHNSDVIMTLGSAQIIVFGSYNFGGTQQFL